MIYYLALLTSTSAFVPPAFRAAAVVRGGVPAMAGGGYDAGKFSGRYALGKNLGGVTSKDGFQFQRKDCGDVRSRSLPQLFT